MPSGEITRDSLQAKQECKSKIQSHRNPTKSEKTDNSESPGEYELDKIESKLKLYSYEMNGLKNRIGGLEHENVKLSGQVAFLLQEKNTLWNV
mgnify:FL=1